MRDPPFGIRALLDPQRHNGTAAKPAHTANDGGVVGERAITREGREVRDQSIDIARGLRTVGMAGDLGFLPGRQLAIDGPQLTVRGGGQPGDLIGDVQAVGFRHPSEFLDLALQLSDRLFEIEEVAHGTGALARFRGRESPPSRRGGPAGCETWRALHRGNAQGRESGGKSGPRFGNSEVRLDLADRFRHG